MADNTRSREKADQEANLLFHIRPIEKPITDLHDARLIEVPPIGDRETARVRAKIVNLFLSEMKTIAHGMCKMKVGGHTYVNRALKDALIKAFREIDDYAVIMTSTSLNKDRQSGKLTNIQDDASSAAREMTWAKEQMVFALLIGPPDRTRKTYELPHKGRIIFFRDENKTLVIPHPEWDIPFAPLTRLNLGPIGGVLGHKLRAAFEDGYKDILRKDDSDRRVKREKDRTLEDLREIITPDDTSDLPDLSDVDDTAELDATEIAKRSVNAPLSLREQKQKAAALAFKIKHGEEDWSVSSMSASPSEIKILRSAESKTEKFKRAAAERERLRLARKQIEQNKAPYIQKEYFRLKAIRDIYLRVVANAQANTEAALQAAIRKAGVASDLATEIKNRQRWVEREQAWIKEATSRKRAKSDIAEAAAKLATRLLSFDQKAAKRFEASSVRNAELTRALEAELEARKKTLAEKLPREEKWLSEAPAMLVQKRLKSFQAAQKLVEVQQRLIDAEALAQKAFANLAAHIANHGVAKPLEKEHQLQTIWKEAARSVAKERLRHQSGTPVGSKKPSKPFLSPQTFSPSTFLQRATMRDTHGRASKRPTPPVAKAWWLKQAGKPMPRR